MKKVFSTLSVALIVVAFGFGWNHISALKKKIDFNFGKEKESGEDGDEDRDATGMVDMLAKMRNNPLTGTIDYADYYGSREAAKQYMAQGYRGGLNLQWQSMGPDNQGGRTRAILIDQYNPNHMFAGSVTGGLWVSNNAGTTWNPVSGEEDFSSLAISCIVQAGNGNIYFGTGEYFGFFPSSNVTGATGFPGGGIWCSQDTGKTFQNIVPPPYGTANIHNPNVPYAFVTAMAADPTDPNRVYATVSGSAGTNSIKPVVIIEGTTVSNAAGTGGAFLTAQQGEDVEVASDGTVHAVIGTNYYRSPAGGTSFAQITTSITNQLNRLVISVSPQDPNYVYAMGSYATSAGNYLKGIWRSTNGGTTFPDTIAGQSIVVSGAPSPIWVPVTQGTYALTLEVSPLDSNLIIFGGIDCYRYSPTLGNEKISTWNSDNASSIYVHADIHTFRFIPGTNSLYVGSDGGINYTPDVATSNVIWSTLNNQYVTTQCYDACAKNFTGEIITGTQDNANWLINFLGNTTRQGNQITGGDGGTVAVSTINPEILYAEYVYGAMSRSSNNGGTFASFYDNNIDCLPKSATGSCSPDGLPDDGAPFIMQYQLWENIYDTNDSTQAKFVLGTNDNVWYTAGALTLTSTPTWFQLTPKGALNGAVSSITFSSDGKTVFAGTENGGLYRIDGLDSVLHYSDTSEFVTGTGYEEKQLPFKPAAFNITTTLIKNFGSGRYVTGIDVDNNDKNHVVVTLGNYDESDYVYQSHNAMDTSKANPVVFNPIQGTGLPLFPVYCALIDKADSNTILIGTEIGIYSTIDSGKTWTIEDNGMPNVPVFRMYRHFLGNQDNVIEASTYGTGVYRTTTIEFTGVQNVAAANTKTTMNVYPDPASSSITLSTVIPNLTDAEVDIYSLDGKLSKTQMINQLTPGVKSITLDIGDLAVGTYLVALKGNGLSRVSKFVVIR